MNRNLFDFAPSAWLPTQDKAVLEYCRNIRREEMETTNENGYSVRDMEEEVRKANRFAAKSEETEPTPPQTFRVDYAKELERKMISALGRKVKVCAKGAKKSVVLYFEDNEDLARALGLRQAPTLVEVKAGNAEKFVNVVAIKTYIQNKTAQTG